MSYNWKHLSTKHKKEFCSLSDCVDLCNVGSSEICSCPKWEEKDGNYKFLTKITKKADNDLKLQLCELTDCSYKTNDLSRADSPCAFYSGKERNRDSQYCSKWFSLKDLSLLLDQVSAKTIDISDMDKLVQEIASRWDLEIFV